jgi:2-C-methyl-D-erythritol 4-phosphate cytidylyltransferase
MKYCALIPAAGHGARMQHHTPKQYLPLRNRPLLWHTIASLTSHPKIDHAALILNPTDPHFCWDDYALVPGVEKLQVYYCGGNTRAESVKQGLQAIENKVDEESWILVHDAARPCLSHDLLSQFIDTISRDTIGGILALPVPETVKAADGQQRICHTIPRSNLWLAQTPQMFRYPLLCQALAHCLEVTDEASAIEALGYAPCLVPSHRYNLKVTYPGDLQLAEAILTLQGQTHE